MTAFIYLKGGLDWQDKPVPFQRNSVECLGCRSAYGRTPLNWLNSSYCCLPAHKTSNLTRYCVLTIWNTKSCPYAHTHKPLTHTHIQSLAKLPWPNACLAACLNTRTHSHSDAHTHDCSTALLFKLMWVLSRHPTSPICSTEALAWESRVTPLALMQIHSVHMRTHSHSHTLAHI